MTCIPISTERSSAKSCDGITFENEKPFMELLLDFKSLHKNLSTLAKKFSFIA